MYNILYKFILFIALSLFLLLSFALDKTNAQSSKKNEIIPASYVIKTKQSENSNKSRAEISTLIQQALKGKSFSIKPIVSNTDRLVMSKVASDFKRAEILSELDRFYYVNIPSEKSTSVLKQLNQLEEIEYAEPRYMRFTTAVPSDSLYYSENEILYTSTDLMRFFEAWDITHGSEEVLIAIVDSGVDYTHPDLENKMWRNEVELNGSPEVDDDGNGKIDDFFGWDFWNAGEANDPEEDNDPMGLNDHGTHVAGISTAEADNNYGLAGASFSSKFLAVKGGGISSSHTSIAFGIDGILYAALTGADIVNCSFTGYAYSQYEQDIIRMVTEMGTLVVAAAGNNGLPQVGYPAAYKDVLAVGWAAYNKSISPSSNIGFDLDVFATGTSIISSIIPRGITGSLFGYKSGTSMATPFVSGLAALIKAEHPDWTPRQIAAQIRSSANIDNIRDYELRGNGTISIGHGMIDAVAALGDQLPGVRVDEYRFVGPDGNKLNFGEEGFLIVSLVNNGATAKNIDFTLNTDQLGVRLFEKLSTLDLINPGDSIDIAFGIEIDSTFDYSDSYPIVGLFWHDNDGYSDRQGMMYNTFVNENVQFNKLKTTISSNGALGFSNPDEGDGWGFIPIVDGKDGQNLLFEGGLMLYIDDVVYSAARGSGQSYSRDFEIVDIFAQRPQENPNLWYGSGKMKIAERLNAPPLEIKVEAKASKLDSLDQSMVIAYEIKNLSADTLKDVRLGLFHDWDLDGSSYDSNQIKYESSDSVMVVYDAHIEQEVSVAPLQNTLASLAIDNGFSGTPDSVHFSIYDGYSQEEKKNSFKAKKAQTEILDGTDISQFVASGPWSIGPGGKIKTAFSISWAADTESLLQQIRKVRNQYWFDLTEPGFYTSIDDEVDLPIANRIVGNYPNPFNPQTTIAFELKQAMVVEMDLYDVQGRLIQHLIPSRFYTAGSHQLRLNATNLASGVYLVVLKSQESVDYHKVTVLK